MKAFILVVCCSISASTLAQTRQVVFVCEHGSAKSMIAAVYFNRIASEKGLSWNAVARGTDPDTVISAKTKILLKDAGLLDSSLAPKKIAQADIDQAQLVYLFFPLPTDLNTHNKTRSWQQIKAVNEDFPLLRDDIVKKIMPLIDSLKANQK